ncbi:MAG: adenylate/guanylate cyclase domain-containing protein [Desulfamplus sp.]|nr:adenylate/guanylate cyclase domain-containing protein [Desulfamplus sp.]
MKTIKSIIIPLILPFVIFIFWTNSSFMELADFAWRDVLYTLRASSFTSSTPNIVDDVVIVAIDEPSFKQLKIRWPWPRTLHAELIEKLSNAGAAAIVFDILFPEKSSDESDDAIFAEAIKKAGNVVLAANLTITGREGYETYFVEEPIEILASAVSAVGMVNFYPDGDGSVRMASNYVDMRPSIALAAATTALNRVPSLNINQHENIMAQQPIDKNIDKSEQANLSTPSDNLDKIPKYDETQAEIGEEEIFFIDYAGKAGTVSAVSYYQVIDNMVDPALFKDKVVFVGFIADSAVEVESGADAYPYPFMRFTKKMMSGVEIQSNVVRTIFRDYPIQEFPFPIVKWLSFYLLASILIPFRKNPVYLTLSTILALGITSLTSIFAFKYQGIIIEVMPAIGAITCNGIFIGLKEFTQSYREKSVLKKAFDSYVSPDVVASVIADHENLKLGGQRKRLSVLFSDIRGFTTLSEKLTPEELVSLLNDYFTRMTDTIFKNKGTLDKYIGDAIMVIFGAPVWSDNHAENGCYTALEMKERLEEMNQENSISSENSINNSIQVSANGKEISTSGKQGNANGKETSTSGKQGNANAKEISTSAKSKIAIGIGINTGEMIVGNMGSLRRFDYTVMGDEVNLASRLEGVTKAYRVQIIISEETRNDLNLDKFLCRELDLIKVKGKYNAIKIYELVSIRPASESDEECIKMFVQGLYLYREAYKENRWDDAIALFKKALEYKEDDGPSKLFIERCETFKQTPPVEAGQEWDGVWVMSTK